MVDALGPVHVIGTIIVLFVVSLLVFPVVYEQWRAAAEHDERWKNALAEIPKAVEIVGLDTRLMRPWGDSAAVERFVVSARGAGHGWLEPAVAPLHLEVPLELRAIAGEIDGVKVAYVLARTRRMGSIAKSLALGPSGPIEELEELAPEDVRPALNARPALERLARRANVVA
jgi:hypothetical protein